MKNHVLDLDKSLNFEYIHRMYICNFNVSDFSFIIESKYNHIQALLIFKKLLTKPYFFW